MVGQLSRQLLAPTLDGLGVETRDAGEGAEGGGMRVAGKGGDIPAALGLAHATEQQVDLVVMAGQLRVSLGLAGVTLTEMHNWIRR